MTDNINLDRFIEAQEGSYMHAVYELKKGRKTSHWMWYIFPQLNGLGSSTTATYYSIKNIEEAKAYIKHPLLSVRLDELCNILIDLESNNADMIFGYPDNLKLKSSMTLFSEASDAEENIFEQVLVKFFDGNIDEKTLDILKNSINN